MRTKKAKHTQRGPRRAGPLQIRLNDDDRAHLARLIKTVGLRAPDTLRVAIRVALLVRLRDLRKAAADVEISHKRTKKADGA